MDQLGTDFHATGSVMTAAQLKEYRLKRGECVTCGRRCFQKKLFKMTPITDHGRVLKGRCLSCAPLDAKDGAIPAVSRRATAQDLMRFSKSQSNLALQTGSGSGPIRSGPPVAQSARGLRPTTSTSGMSVNSTTSSNRFSRALSSDSLRDSLTAPTNVAASRGLSVRSGLSSGSADTSGAWSPDQPTTGTPTTTGSLRDQDIPQRVNLATTRALMHGNSSVRSVSRDSLFSQDESVATNTSARLPQPTIMRPPPEFIIEEELFKIQQQQARGSRPEYLMEGINDHRNTLNQSNHSNHSRPYLLDQNHSHHSRPYLLDANHSNHSRRSPVVLSTSGHMLRGSMRGSGSEQSYHRGVDYERYDESENDQSFGGDEDYYQQDQPRGGYDDHHHHPRDEFDGPPPPRDFVDGPPPRGFIDGPPSRGLDNYGCEENPHSFRGSPRGGVASSYVDPRDEYDDHNIEYQHSSKDSRGSRRLSGDSFGNRSSGANSRRSAGPPHHRHHNHHRGGGGNDEDESHSNISETFDEFTSLPSFHLRAMGEEIHDEEGMDEHPEDAYRHHGGPMDRRENELDNGNQDAYYYERQQSDRSLGNSSANNGSNHVIARREPSIRSFCSVNTEEEIAAFERRRSHGILNRGGAVNLSDMTGGGPQARDRRCVARTHTSSDHGSSFHNDQRRYSGGGGGRSGSYRNLSNRSLDSVSSFGDDHNSMPVATIERQESMRSLGSQSRRNNARRQGSSDQHLGSSSNHSFGLGNGSRPPTHNSSSSQTQSRNSAGSDHRRLDGMDILAHSVTVVGDVGCGPPVKGIDVHHNSGSTADVTALVMSSRQNSQASFGNYSSTDEGLERLNAAGTNFIQIIQIMKVYSNSEPVQTHCMQEISNLHLTPEECDTLSDVGGIEAIMDAMRNFPKQTELQLCACRALCNISGTQENQYALVDAGAAAWLLDNTMENFAEIPELQEHAMAALANLAALEDNLTHLIENEIVSRVVQAMGRHGNDIQVQMKGCSVITNLASHPTPMKASVMMAGGGGAVVMAMVIHAKNAHMQEKGLQALRNLSANCEENKLELAHIGGIDASITAMQIHRDDPHVQQAGAWTLCNLAGNMNNKYQIGDSGGIDVIIRAMWVHSEQVAVHEWCARALASLSLHPGNCRAMLNVGAISAIVNATQAHEKSSVVQEMGCAVLCNLASDEAAKVRIVDEEALDAIVLAMVLFGDDVKVQERACQVVLKLTIPQNVTAIHASNVVELVRVAAVRFPENCSGPANELMDILEECSGGYGLNRGAIPVMGGGI